MTEPRTRWPLRLVQFSPLVALGLIALLVGSVPSALRAMTPDLASSTGQNMSVRQLRTLADAAQIAPAQAAANLYTDSGPSFDSAAGNSWLAFSDAQGSYVSTRGVTGLPLQSDSRVFGDISAWEKAHHAAVWAWLAQPGPFPALAASATGDPVALEATLRQGGAGAAWYASSYRAQDRFLRYLVENNQPAPESVGALPPLNPQLYQVSGGGGSSGDGLAVFNASMSSHGRFYLIVTSYSIPQEDDGTHNREVPTTVTEADPSDPGFGAIVARAARDAKLNIWVFGPLQTKLTPLRIPRGVDRAQADAAGQAVWPVLSDGNSSPSLHKLPADAAQHLGASWGALTAKSMWNSPEAAGSGWIPTGQIAPQTVIYLATFRTRPGGDPTALQAAWQAWSMLLAGYYPWLLGGLIALLGVTLIASPVAFTVDRRRRARQRVRDELARMQRDAHDKVYNRLSALSKRVGQAGNDAQSDLSRSLSAIADDIRGTVGELQAILGEEGVHTDTSLATVPLAEQIAAVTRAQSARLGVQIVFRASDDLPEVSAKAGWDLQCIAEEAITNAVRHGHAHTIEVALGASAGSMVLRIADDGCGPEAGIAIDELPQTSTGLRGAAARVARRGGTLDVRSGATGTTIVAKIPLGEHPDKA